MATTLRHRGPDTGGAWVDEAAGIALGHRRLSIVDLSPAGNQPMESACRRYLVVLNGEIYNFGALRRELEDLGHSFRGHSDTEVMLAATSKWGLEEALKRFNGMFAFALWDRHERALHLVRDRLGEKPLYYGWIDDVCVFASELKAFHAYPGFRGEIDRDAVALYLRHNYVPAPLSIYRGVYKLPAATILSMTEKTVGSAPKPASYWSVREVAERGVADPMTGHENDIVAELHELLKDAVALRMEAEVPLGAFLSGGVDSSTVVALMQAQSRTPVRTFSIGFYEDDYNEAEDAKAVARRLGTEHTELYVTPDEAMAVIPHLPTLYDEPFADSSQIPTFLISQLARRDVTVALSGDGGDELFGGYDRYLWGRRIWGKIRWCPAPVRRTAGNLLTLLSPAVWDRGYSSAAALLPPRLRQRNPGEKVHKLAEILSAESADAMYLSLVSHSKEPTLLVPGSSEPTTTLTDRKEWAKLADFTQRMQYLDTVTYLPDDILVKLDRASMGVSLEARVPLLDHRVVEWAWRIPVSLKFHRRASKWLLRQVLYHYVSKDIIERPKMGFGVPIGKWLRGPLRHWAESLLDERRLSEDSLFSPAPIREKWLEHLSGRRNWQYYLWSILVFQAWKGYWR